MSRNQDTADIAVARAISVGIAGLRVARGWTQLELAGRAGVARQTLNLIERGKLEPRVCTLARIAVALRVAAGELYPDQQKTRAEAYAILDRLPDHAITDVVRALEVVARAHGPAAPSAASGRSVKVQARARKPKGSRPALIERGVRHG